MTTIEFDTDMRGVVGKTNSRYAPQHLIVCHDGNGKAYAIATEGRVLAAVPVQVSGADTPGTYDLSPGILPSRKNDRTVRITDDGEARYGDRVASLDTGNTFPPFRDAIMEDRPITFTIGIDAKLLLALQNAISDDGNGIRLELSENTRPVRAVGNRGIGVIMPVKLQDDESTYIDTARDVVAVGDAAPPYPPQHVEDTATA